MQCPHCESSINKSHLLYGIAVEAQNQGFNFGVTLEKSLEDHGVEDGDLSCPSCERDIDLADAIKSTGLGNLVKACSAKQKEAKMRFKEMIAKKQGKVGKKANDSMANKKKVSKSTDNQVIEEASEPALPCNNGNTGHFYMRGGEDDKLAKAIEEKRVVQSSSPRHVDNWAKYGAPKW